MALNEIDTDLGVTLPFKSLVFGCMYLDCKRPVRFIPTQHSLFMKEDHSLYRKSLNTCSFDLRNVFWVYPLKTSICLRHKENDWICLSYFSDRLLNISLKNWCFLWAEKWTSEYLVNRLTNRFLNISIKTVPALRHKDNVWMLNFLYCE